MTHGLPIFVILPGKTSRNRRTLRLGWVCHFDDENRQFLILFSEQKPPNYSKAESEDAPFLLTAEVQEKTNKGKARPGQQRFRFNVLAKYGAKCAVCDIRHSELLIAAHICGKEHKGSDDWRNGIPLCATHHVAFDRHFFAIDPETCVIRYKPGLDPKDIGLTQLSLQTMKNLPHVDALKWRWEETEKEWKRD